MVKAVIGKSGKTNHADLVESGFFRIPGSEKWGYSSADRAKIGAIARVPAFIPAMLKKQELPVWKTMMNHAGFLSIASFLTHKRCFIAEQQ